MTCLPRAAVRQVVNAKEAIDLCNTSNITVSVTRERCQAGRETGRGEIPSVAYGRSFPVCPDGQALMTRMLASVGLVMVLGIVRRPAEAGAGASAWALNTTL